MPKRRRVPSLVHHKPTNQGRVRLDGVGVYCGVWGNPFTEERYRHTAAERLVTGRVPQVGAETESSTTVAGLMAAFWRHAEKHYVKNGKPTAEQHCFKSAFKPLRKLYGTTPVDEFGPIALKIVRKQYIAHGWCRAYVNKPVSRVRLMFRWGVENELVSPITLQALEAVAGLKAGRTKAPDHAKRHGDPDLRGAQTHPG